MASFLEIGSFDEPPPFGLSIPPDELRYQSKVGRELIRSLAEGAELYFIGLDDSQVEIVTREYALEEEFYNLVGVAFGSLSEPSWIFWRPCDYNQTLEGWLVLPEIKNYSVIFRSPDREEPGNRDGCI